MDTTIAATHASPRAREGKFTNLDAFLSGAEDGLNRISHYVPASQAELAPGHIIHVKDNKQGTETRIHNRIVLVVKNNAPVSMTENLGDLPLLEVVLHYKLSPKGDITINLRDPWNVEYEVEVAKLGIVPVKSYGAVRQRINTLSTLESYNSPLLPLISNTASQSADIPGSAPMVKSKSTGSTIQGEPIYSGQRTRRPSELQRSSGLAAPFFGRW